MATLGKPVPGPWDRDLMAVEDWTAYDKAEREAFDKLSNTSDNLRSGEVVGAILQFPRGDGAAFYLVSSAKPLVLRWIPYGDRWQTDGILIRGLRLADVKKMVGADRRLASIFGRSKAELA